MAVVVEQFDSSELNVEAGKRGTELRFKIALAYSESEAEAALVSELPASLPGGQRLQSYRVTPLGVDLYEATATYKSGTADGESGGGAAGGGSAAGSGPTARIARNREIASPVRPSRCSRSALIRIAGT